MISINERADRHKIKCSHALSWLMIILKAAVMIIDETL